MVSFAEHRNWRHVLFTSDGPASFREMAARAGNGETFVIKQPLNLKNCLDVFAPV